MVFRRREKDKPKTSDAALEVHQSPHLKEDMCKSDHDNRRSALQKKKEKRGKRGGKWGFAIGTLDTYDTDTNDIAVDHASLLYISVYADDDWHSCASSSTVCRCGFTKEQMHMCERVLWRRTDIAKHGTSYPLYQCFVKARLGAEHAFIISPSGASMSIKLLYPWPHFL
jgi:hypothetical protein